MLSLPVVLRFKSSKNFFPINNSIANAMHNGIQQNIESDKNWNVTKMSKIKEYMLNICWCICRKEYYTGLKNICLIRIQVTKQCIQQDSYFVGKNSYKIPIKDSCFREKNCM